MDERKRVVFIDQKDREFIKEISRMSVHRKLLLHGILIGIAMADQGMEKESIEPKR